MLSSTSPQALAQAFSNAQGLHEQGRLAEAEAGYQQILLGTPDQVDTLHMLGILMIQTDRAERGFGLIDRALAIQPKFADAHFNRAVAATQLGRHGEALAGLDRVLALQPDDHLGARYTRGLVLAQLGRPAEAVTSFSDFLRRQPRHPDTLINRGVALSVLGRHAEALADFDAVIALTPQDPQAHFNRGGALKALGRIEDAKTAFERALALRPGWPDALVNRGVTLKMLGRAEDALVDYDRALAAQPDHVEGLISRGAALAELMRSDEALVDYGKALAISPGVPLALFNRSLELLLTGQFEQGWREYESRQAVDAAWVTKRAASLTGPAWDGRALLRDKTLFAYWEQGFGDTIQFCRFASVAADQGGRVILSVQNGLRPLLTGFDPRVTVIGAQETPEAYDFHTALMSLPGAFGATAQTIPAASGYLTADAAQSAAWAQRLGMRKRPRIGVVWSGAAAHESDHNRSLPLAALGPLLDFEADWFCLQKDLREPDRPVLAASPIQRIEEAVNGFAPTAALIDNLDLVVSVDTSIAHLAAAMGKPTWVLLSTAPDWRWMQGREDSPWYDSVRLFRQTAPRDWAGVVDQVRAALAERFG